MQPIKELLKIACLAIVFAGCAAGIYGGFGLNQHIIQAVDTYADTGRKLNGKNGTIAELDKLILATKSLEVHADIALAHEDKQLTTLDSQEQQLFADLHQTTLSLQSTADASTGTIKNVGIMALSASDTLRTTNDTIGALRQPINDSGATIRRVNVLLDSPDLVETLHNVKSMTASGNRIGKDAADVADRYAHPPRQHWYVKMWDHVLDAGKLYWDFTR